MPRNGPSNTASTTTATRMPANAIAPTSNAFHKLGDSTSTPVITAGSNNTGTIATVANCSNVNAVIPDAAVAVSMPASDSIRTWSVAPAAAPAGRIELSAFDASCEVAIASHWVVRVASRSNNHTITKLVASHANTTKIHPSPTSESCGKAENASMTLGNTK